MPSEARQKKIMEKLNRAQKCSILGPQNPGSGGARAPPGSAPGAMEPFVLGFDNSLRRSGRDWRFLLLVELKGNWGFFLEVSLSQDEVPFKN